MNEKKIWPPQLGNPSYEPGGRSARYEAGPLDAIFQFVLFFLSAKPHGRACASRPTATTRARTPPRTAGARRVAFRAADDATLLCGRCARPQRRVLEATPRAGGIGGAGNRAVYERVRPAAATHRMEAIGHRLFQLGDPEGKGFIVRRDMQVREGARKRRRSSGGPKGLDKGFFHFPPGKR